MDLDRMESTNHLMTRKVRARRKLMAPNQQEEQLLQMRNQRTERLVVKCSKYHQHPANKAVLKIMMMERKKRKEINSQRNLKIDVIE